MKTKARIWIGLLLLAICVLLPFPFLKKSTRFRALKADFEPRGGTVITKDAWPSWLSDLIEVFGLTPPQVVYAVGVPDDFAVEEWPRLDGFPQLRDISLAGASFQFDPSDVPRSVDRVVLGSVEVDPKALKAARPDLSFSVD